MFQLTFHSLAVPTAVFLLTLAAAALADESGETASPRRAERPSDPSDRSLDRLDPARGLGLLLEKVWAERSEWGDMAVAALKDEPMSSRNSWWRPSRCLYDWDWLQTRFDHDSDGRIDRRELPGAEDLLTGLDRDADGFLVPEDLEPAAAPEATAEVRTLFRRLDHDGNGRASWDELSWFFQEADRRKRGFLSVEDLQAVLSPGVSGGGNDASEKGRDGVPPRHRLLSLLFSGELGSFREGPELGESAPEIRLPERGGDVEETFSALAEHRGRRPVVLIFGSFT